MGDAHLALGRIALRRGQKKNACRYFEAALACGVKDAEAKSSLRSAYEKEFFKLFQRERQSRRDQEQAIALQSERIESLTREIRELRGQTETFKRGAANAKKQRDHSRRQYKKILQERLEGVRSHYEGRLREVSENLETVAEEARELKKERLSAEIDATLRLETRADEGVYNNTLAMMEAYLGCHAWQVLHEETRQLLITAEYVYQNMGGAGMDFGLVGMELCKSVEVEVNEKLVHPFVRHLERAGLVEEFLSRNKVGERAGAPLYHSRLANVVDRAHYSGFRMLTLGQFLFTLQQIQKSDYCLEHFEEFLAGSGMTGEIVDRWVDKCAQLVMDYRNPLAHASILDRESCGDLRRLVYIETDSLMKSLANYPI